MAELKPSLKGRLKGILLCGCGILLFCGTPGLAQPGGSLEPPPGGVNASRLEQFPQVHSYDLGGASLTQTGVSPQWETMPFTLNGTLALPGGSGPFPVVLLLHGRHPGCHFQDTRAPSPWPCPPGTETRFDQGFAYLAQALAEAGYLAIAPNLNAAYANAYGATPGNRNDLTDARLQQIIAAHWQSLQAAQAGKAEGFPVSLRGKVDLSQVALMGHSLGGGAAVSILQQQSKPISSSEDGAVQALMLVSPTPSRAMATYSAAYQLPDIPTTIVVGGCDRDVYDLSSLYYFETADQDFTRQTPVTALLLPGANHNFFNAAIAQDDYYRQPDDAALCNPQQSELRLSRVDQEYFLVQYALDFLGHFLGGPDRSRSVGSPHAISTIRADALYGFPVLSNLTPPSNQRLRLFKLSEIDPSHLENSPGMPHASGAVSLSLCQNLQPCNDSPPYRPAFPSVLHVSWEASGGRLQFQVPEGRDLRDFDVLQLRLASFPAPSSTTARDGFAVVLQDESGQAVRVEIPPSTAALQHFPSDPGQPGEPALVYPSQVNIPLLQFRGVDLNRLTTVDLIFDPDTTGELLLAGIEFLKYPEAGIPITHPWPAVPASAASEFWPAHRGGIDNVRQ